MVSAFGHFFKNRTTETDGRIQKIPGLTEK